MRSKRLAVLTVILVLMAAGAAHAQVLELSGKEARDPEKLIASVAGQGSLSKIIFDETVIAPENLQTLKTAFPDVEMEYSVSVLGRHYRWDAEQINLNQTPVNGGKDFEKLMKVLPWLPKLAEIRALKSSFTYDEIERIRQVLPDVHVSGKLRVNKHYVRSDLTAFSTRHSKTSTRYSSDDMRVLKYTDHLQALDIGHNAVDDLSFLYDLPHLRVLILADNQITDLTPVASLKHLEYLEVFINPLTDISPLAECENLMDLHIGECNISDFSPLYGLKKLNRLWMSANPFTEDDVQKLQKALPNCVINTTASQIATTAEGWRQGHPRYLWIVDMFEKGTFKEFTP